MASLEDLSTDIRVAHYSFARFNELVGRTMVTRMGAQFKIELHEDRVYLIKKGRKDADFVRNKRAVTEEMIRIVALRVPTSSSECELYCRKFGVHAGFAAYIFQMLLELGMTHYIPPTRGIAEERIRVKRLKKQAERKKHSASLGIDSSRQRVTSSAPPVFAGNDGSPQHGRRAGRSITPRRR